MLITVLEPDFKYEDDRGCIFQLIHYGYRQVNMIKSIAGAKRGDHYHKHNNELFFIVSGKLIVNVQAVSRDEKHFIGSMERYVFSEKDMFSISPFMNHQFEFLEDTILISMYNKGVEYDDGGKDIYNFIEGKGQAI